MRPFGKAFDEWGTFSWGCCLCLCGGTPGWKRRRGGSGSPSCRTVFGPVDRRRRGAPFSRAGTSALRSPGECRAEGAARPFVAAAARKEQSRASRAVPRQRAGEEKRLGAMRAAVLGSSPLCPKRGPPLRSAAEREAGAGRPPQSHRTVLPARQSLGVAARRGQRPLWERAFCSVVTLAGGSLRIRACAAPRSESLAFPFPACFLRPGMAAAAAAAAALALQGELAQAVACARVLVVGAGGIGCELLKDLVLTGFAHIDVIDLDTIDVSNLNRQFLFQKKHVGRSKAQVAKESVLQFHPQANIIAYHDSIMNPDYNVEFFRQFTLVMNALDNRAARNHVNRMCLAADVPLIESGTAGYLGQVTVIKKGVTECYECHPKPTQKTFPGCTIRNTPSEPIHCIVWAKYLFNQLFGEEDADQEVSPDRADPEAAWEPAEAEARARASNEDGDIKRVSTKEWAKSTGYDAVKLFTKLFKDDIRYLLTMDKLWRKRKPPIPLDWNEIQNQDNSTFNQQNESPLGLKDQQVLDVKSYAHLFAKSIETLRVQLAEKGDGAELVWDKDDSSAMDFVTSAANLRMHIFSMNMKSRFDIKSMAGNIIPAIATTNAIIAGLIVLEGLKILSGKIEQCRAIFLNKQPNPKKKLLVPCALDPPNPNCYVCASKPEVTVKLNVHKVTVLTLQDKIVKEKFNMVAPDVQIEDGKGTILISSEEGETEANNHKKLSEFGIRNGTRLQADDFLQDYTLLINVLHSEDLAKDLEFEVVGDEIIGPKSSEQPTRNITNGSDDGAQPSTSTAQDEDDEDVLIVETEEDPSKNADDTEAKNRKRKLDDKEYTGAKRMRSELPDDKQDDVIALD
ncbi:SUMO-activating enzyme subunit 2 [Liasis olivaceus]